MNRCIECGEPMEAYYSRSGQIMFVCPNVRLTIKYDELIAIGYKFCEIGISTHGVSSLSVNPQEAINLYANLKSLRESFEKLVKTLTLETLREATHNTVSDIDLLKYANLALMLGSKEEQIPKLFNSAIRLGYAVGITSKKSIESLSKGIARQSYLILDNIGITFRAHQAWKWYEEAKGFTKLDVDQKKEAWRQYAIKLVIEKSRARM